MDTKNSKRKYTDTHLQSFFIALVEMRRKMTRFVQTEKEIDRMRLRRLAQNTCNNAPDSHYMKKKHKVIIN